MSTELVERPRRNLAWLRSAWPLVFVLLPLAAPRIERAWDAYRVRQLAEPTSAATPRERIRARILRVEPGALRENWNLGGGDRDGVCDTLYKGVSWTVCWLPTGAFSSAWISGGSRDKPHESIQSIMWVFSPHMPPAERAALTALAGSGKGGAVVADGLNWKFEPTSYGYTVTIMPSEPPA